MKQKKQPKYRKIAAFILKSAEQSQGIFAQSQLDIAKQFEVNRLTVRQAFNWLEREQLLYHVSGWTWRLSTQPSAPFLPTVSTKTPSKKIGYPIWVRSFADINMPHMLGRFGTTRSIHSELLLHGYELDIQCVGLPTKPNRAKIAQLIKEWQGVVLEPMQGESAIKDDHPFAAMSPYTVAFGVLQARKQNTVCPDFYEGVHIAIDEMVRLGSRRILYAGYLEELSSHRFLRLAAVEEAVARYPDVTLVCTDGGYFAEQSFSGVKRFLLEGGQCDGILAASGYVVQGALRALADCHQRVPEDVQIISLGRPSMAEYMTPLPTIVAGEKGATGRAIAQMILQLLRNNGTPVPNMLIPMKLIRGETTRQKYNKNVSHKISEHSLPRTANRLQTTL